MIFTSGNIASNSFLAAQCMAQFLSLSNPLMPGKMNPHIGLEFLPRYGTAIIPNLHIVHFFEGLLKNPRKAKE